MKMMGQDQVKNIRKALLPKKSISPPVKKTNFTKYLHIILPLSLSFFHHHHLQTGMKDVIKRKKGFRVENWINMGFSHVKSKSEIGRFGIGTPTVHCMCTLSNNHRPKFPTKYWPNASLAQNILLTFLSCFMRIKRDILNKQLNFRRN